MTTTETETGAPAIRWQLEAGEGDLGGGERAWRAIMLYEAAFRATFPVFVRGVELVSATGKRPSTDQDRMHLVDTFSDCIRAAAGVAVEVAEALRHMPATPETDHPADMEAKLREIALQAFADEVWEDERRAITDLSYLAELRTRADAAEDARHDRS